MINRNINSIFLTSIIAVLLIISCNFDYEINADFVYLPSMILDLMNGGNFSNWRTPPSPYLFPDSLFVFISMIFTRNFFLIIKFSIILQIFSIFILSWKFLNFLYDDQLFRSFNIFKYYFFLILMLSYFLLFNDWQYVSCHFGQVIVQIGLLYLILKFIKLVNLNIVNKDITREKNKIFAKILIIVSLTYFSDALFLASSLSFIFVSLTSYFLSDEILKKRDFLKLALVVCGGLFFGKLFVYLAPNIPSSPLIYATKNIKNDLIELLLNYLNNDYIYLSFIFVLIVLSLVTNIFLKTYKSKSIDVKDHSTLLTLDLFTLGIVILLSLANAAPGLLVFTPRYVPGKWYFLVLGYGVLFLIVIKSKILQFYISINCSNQKYLNAFLTLVFSFILIKVFPFKSSILEDKVDHSFTCLSDYLKENNLSYGVTHYWQAKPFNYIYAKPIAGTLKDNSGPYLAQVRGDNFKKKWWISNKNEYKNKFNYVVVDLKMKKKSALDAYYKRHYLDPSIFQKKIGEPFYIHRGVCNNLFDIYEYKNQFQL